MPLFLFISILSSLSVCLMKLVLSVIVSYWCIINVSPYPPSSKSPNMFKSLPSLNREQNESYCNLMFLSSCYLLLSPFFFIKHHEIITYSLSLGFCASTKPWTTAITVITPKSSHCLPNSYSQRTLLLKPSWLSHRFLNSFKPELFLCLLTSRLFLCSSPCKIIPPSWPSHTFGSHSQFLHFSYLPHLFGH